MTHLIGSLSFSYLFHITLQVNDSPAYVFRLPCRISSMRFLCASSAFFLARFSNALVIDHAAFGNPATTLTGPPPRCVRFFLFPRGAFFLFRPPCAFLLTMVRLIFGVHTTTHTNVLLLLSYCDETSLCSPCYNFHG